MTDYESLKQFARNKMDVNCLNMLASGITQKDAADLMGVTTRSVERRLKNIRDAAALRGWSPEHDMTKTTPETHIVKGTSTLYGATGDQKLQWVKTNVGMEQQLEALREAVEALKEDIPTQPPIPFDYASQRASEKLLNLHVLTDYHMGMLSWGEESGEDWDIKIAERMLIEWFAHSLLRAPKAKIGVLANIGDLLHFDGMQAITPTSGNLLDSDTRYPKVVRVVIRSLVAVINMMLQKYEYVHLIMSDANHDMAGEVWLREMFSVFYANEDRISVDTNPSTYNCIEHGLTSIFFHHGHKKKVNNVDSVFAAKYREVFGRTKFSYCHMGHLHHIEVKESNLMIVEQHRTMAPNDAYSSSHGYLTGRSAPIITYHKEFGEVGRITVTPEMLEV